MEDLIETPMLWRTGESSMPFGGFREGGALFVASTAVGIRVGYVFVI